MAKRIEIGNTIVPRAIDELSSRDLEEVAVKSVAEPELSGHSSDVSNAIGTDEEAVLQRLTHQRAERDLPAQAQRAHLESRLRNYEEVQRPDLKRRSAYTAGPGYEEVRSGKELHRNHMGAGVTTLQQKLNAAGFLTKVDGYFGPKTEEAIKNFQRANHLPQTGILDRQTLESLEKSQGKTQRLPNPSSVKSEPGLSAKNERGFEIGSNWQTGKWVNPSDFRDPKVTGEQKYEEAKHTKKEIYDEISKVAPGLPHKFKLMLVGHAWQEQTGKAIINNNYAGIEGDPRVIYKDPNRPYVWVDNVSTTISREEYLKHKDDNPPKYKDWDYKRHKPGNNVSQYGPAGTIQVQLDRGDPYITVMHRAVRPAYKDLTEGSAAFVSEVERRMHWLQKSEDPKMRDLAQRALDGDSNAYGQIVGMKTKGFGAYNPDPIYSKLVTNSIDATVKDLSLTPKEDL